MASLRSLLWYLRRPPLFPELARQVGRRLRNLTRAGPDPESLAPEAAAWCRERAVEAERALRTLLGPGARVPDLGAEHGPALAAARRAAAACPHPMGGPAHLALLYGLAEGLGATTVVETGVAYGWSSLALLLSLKSRPGSRLISTDRPYVGMDNEGSVGCVVDPDLRPLWTLIPLADREALPLALSATPSFDLCHYDSDKTYEGRLWAYPRLWSSLRPGGVFVTDDAGDNFAFRDFCGHLGAEPVVVAVPEGPSVKYAGLLRK